MHNGRNRKDLLSFNQKNLKKINNLLKKERNKKRKEKRMINQTTTKNKNSRFPLIFNNYLIN